MNHWEVRSALCSIEKKGHIFRKLNTGDGDFDNMELWMGVMLSLTVSCAVLVRV